MYYCLNFVDNFYTINRTPSVVMFLWKYETYELIWDLLRLDFMALVKRKNFLLRPRSTWQRKSTMAWFSRCRIRLLELWSFRLQIQVQSSRYTGTPPLTRFFEPGKNRVKGKPCYRRSILVLKPQNGEFEHSNSTFWAKCTANKSHMWLM